jgi:hypothetical protein
MGTLVQCVSRRKEFCAAPIVRENLQLRLIYADHSSSNVQGWIQGARVRPTQNMQKLAMRFRAWRLLVLVKEYPKEP